MSDWEERVKIEDKTIAHFARGVKTLWSLLGDTKKVVLLILGMTILVEIASLVAPYLLKLVFDEIPRALAEQEFSPYLVVLVVGMFAADGLLLLFVFKIREPLFLKNMIKLENWWPTIVQKKLLSLSLGYHERENTGKKVSKITKGCDKLGMLLQGLFWDFLPQLFFLAINMIVLAVIDWKLGLIFSLPVIPVVVILVKVYNRVEVSWKDYEKKKERAGGLFCQSLINIKTVQSFVQEKQEISNHATVCEDIKRVDTNVSLKTTKYHFWTQSILLMSLVLTIVAGIYFVFIGTTTLGTVVYIIATGNSTQRCLNQMIRAYTEIMRDMVTVQRMKELLDEEPEIKNLSNARVPKKYEGSLILDRLSFRYPQKDTPVLDDLTLKIRPGEMVALVGKSGAGKTTAIRLLCRMYDVDTGRILLDGSDIRSLDLYWYRRLFSMVQQDVDIFDNTLLANIAYPYPDTTKEQILEAVKASHLEVFTDDKDRFPEGLNTEVGERGVKLSGGERQRVGIARAYVALLNGAKILILDEATSNLDSEAERAIQEMIDKARKKLNISVVAIAHRLSTVYKADKIYVIEDSKVIEQGSHNHLISQEGHYRHLVELQEFRNGS